MKQTFLPTTDETKHGRITGKEKSPAHLNPLTFDDDAVNLHHISSHLCEEQRRVLRAEPREKVAESESQTKGSYLFLTSSILYVSGVTSARQNPGHIDCNFNSNGRKKKKRSRN
jgi:hypothetical protein